ncbi:flavin reductase family protein [Desulforamulus aeronauticus]|uniref:NADH-FMN oxidoreductase RutF, flavin reductase (DIM6/NTAB) family n=1 Tax=Desulforamulus aeronauticus DSM 10349 TaxID=1121421 RepID=A0A1M6SN07_9FIRM|nr:flavin reductase family protein [Desulforamulus aeronauticus]SHK45989.1 NADH-FMN oxidoreductase RutF, flavin reductase (DIM6/NTAB) family [Desulforamulus aeronauticus DSM 10349]
MSYKGPVYIWKCTVCGDKHYAKNPPGSCRKCHSEANRYILLPNNGQGSGEELQNYFGIPSLNSLLYLIGSTRKDIPNAMCCSSVTQITYGPPQVAVAINKNTLTHDNIKETGVFSLVPLGHSQTKMAHHFGRNSGRQIDKFLDYQQKPAKTGSPIIEGCDSYYDCLVDHSATIELASHTLFVAKIIEAAVKTSEPPLTYLDYIKNMSNF